MISRKGRKGKPTQWTQSILTVLFVTFLLVSCKDDPKFTSAAGDWTYTTPDGKIGVDFTLEADGTNYKMTKGSIRVEGTVYETITQYTTTTAGASNIGAFRLNANDTKAVYAYFLQFPGGTVNGDFTEIKGPQATYSWPHDKTNQLTEITISRK